MARKEKGKVELGKLRALGKNRYWSEKEGRAALTAFEASGLTWEAFRRTTGITPQRLKWWRRRHGASPGGGKVEFLPVQVPASEPTGGAAMEIAIGEIRIRFGPGFDPDALHRLLAVVAEPAC